MEGGKRGGGGVGREGGRRIKRGGEEEKGGVEGIWRAGGGRVLSSEVRLEGSEKGGLFLRAVSGIHKGRSFGCS